MPTIALVILGIAGLAMTARILVGPSVADRIVAMDGLLVIVVSALVVDAARTGRIAFIDIAVVMGLLGFIGTGVAARFIERRGA